MAARHYAAMYIFTRYVLREVLQVFVAAVFVTTALLALLVIAKEGMRKGLPPAVLLRMFPYLLPDLMRFTAPGCILFAVCMVYGRMAGNNELVAIKSIGICPTIIVWPVLTLALLLSVYTYALQELLGRWSGPGLARVALESVEEIAYGALRAERTFRSPQSLLRGSSFILHQLL